MIFNVVGIGIKAFVVNEILAICARVVKKCNKYSEGFAMCPVLVNFTSSTAEILICF